MGYQVHRLGSGQVDRATLRRARRVMATGVDHSVSQNLRQITGESNPTLDHFHQHIIRSITGKPLTRPENTFTDAFLRSMSDLGMPIDNRPSAGNGGELYHSNMAELADVFPWMYQMNLLMMQTMLSVSMLSVGGYPAGINHMREALADSWMGDGEYATMLDNLCTTLLAPIFSVLRESAGGPPVGSTRGDLSFLIEMDSDEALDYMVGTMFIADMVFNHF